MDLQDAKVQEELKFFIERVTHITITRIFTENVNLVEKLKKEEVEIKYGGSFENL